MSKLTFDSFTALAQYMNGESEPETISARDAAYEQYDPYADEIADAENGHGQHEDDYLVKVAEELDIDLSGVRPNWTP